jgi:hypothetical protein
MNECLESYKCIIEIENILSHSPNGVAQFIKQNYCKKINMFYVQNENCFEL